MEMSKKYIDLCSYPQIQDLCNWSAGDRFLIKSQDLFAFLEKVTGIKEEAKCIVWIPNYDSSFSMDKQDLLWIPNLSQVISIIKKIVVNLNRMSLEYREGEWSCTLDFIPSKSEKRQVITARAKTGKTACMEALVNLVQVR